ncbi:hypothetical protein NDU88_000184 [Pleurodeles waltl]|uniref:Uncharacterized protein n=1 Tax=Pleurodeles waltl TaxID=8319 RepID=A0AAV7P1T0_PLEWA|nr:hypothetical protein NDU88_000184 [Pleurodeles waltl]
MSEGGSDEEQVKFRDVAACFSEEDWKNLQEWQKDFYKNVMKEIHQALIVLGYQILNPDSLLRIYKGNDVYVQEPFEARRTNTNEGIGSSHPTVSPDILLRITHEEKSCWTDVQLPEDAEVRNTSSSCSPDVSAAFVVSEEELEPHPINHHDSERQESNLRSSSSVAVPEVLVVTVNEDDDVYSVDEEDCEIIESSDELTGDVSRNQQMEASVSKQSASRMATKDSTTWEKNSKAFQNFHYGPNPRSQRPSETLLETKRGKASQLESVFSIAERRALLPGSPKSNGELESYLRNSLLRTGLPNTQHNQMAYRITDFDRSYLQKRDLARHMVTYSGLGPYECTECEKRFFNKSNLKKHYRTHTGERPHKCTFCPKRFSRTDNLNRHIRIHTRRLKRQTL